MTPRRGGLALVEILMGALIVAVTSGLILERAGGLLDPDGAVTEPLCQANRRNLEAALVVWHLDNPGANPPSLPANYPDLMSAGLLRTMPRESRTEAWDHTYATTPRGRVFCRVHQGRELLRAPPPDARRNTALCLMAAGLVLATLAMLLLLHGKNPHRPQAPPREPARLPGDRRMLREVREYLRAQRDAGSSTELQRSLSDDG